MTLTIPLPNFDDHTYEDLVELARKLIPREYPEWTDHNPTDPGIILLELLAWLTEMVLYRVNQVPDENYWTFLKLLNPQEEWYTLKDQAQDLQAAIRQTVLDLQKRYRAVTCEDFEKLALEDWNQTQQDHILGEVKRAKCFPQHNLAATDAAARDALAPGHVSLVIVPKVLQIPLNVLTFDGKNSYVEIKYGDRLDPGANDWTMELWFKWNGNNILGDARLYHGQKLRMVLKDKQIIYNWFPSDWSGNTPFKVEQDKWYHAAVVYDHEKQFLYKNGENVFKMEKVTQNIGTQTDKRWLLGKSFDSNFFPGQIAEFRIWNTARTPEQIRANMYRQLTGKEEGLVGYWPLDEGSGNTVYDKTSNGNNGTIQGAQWTTDKDLKVNKIPIPTPMLRTALWKYLDERRLVTTRHHVVEPDYVPVKITAKLWLMDGADSQNVSTRAKGKVCQFFDPLKGGVDGKGWPFGRSVYISEVYSFLDNVDGVDYVTDVKLNGGVEAIALLEYQLVAVQLEENSFTIQEAWRVQGKG